jgi:hypothetical protein
VPHTQIWSHTRKKKSSHGLSRSPPQWRKSARVVQRVARKYIGRLRWKRIRKGVQYLHVLARAFVVKEHVNKMMAAVNKLQVGLIKGSHVLKYII